jgi:hypothetical protein
MPVMRRRERLRKAGILLGHCWLRPEGTVTALWGPTDTLHVFPGLMIAWIQGSSNLMSQEYLQNIFENLSGT